MRRIEDHVPLARLYEYFECDPVAGVLRWKHRVKTCYRVATWNKRFAGQVAGRPNAKGYIQISVVIDDVKWMTTAHRLIWAFVHGDWAPIDREIDHENGLTGDNRLKNMRLCNPLNNIKNKGLYKNNKSGFKGVCWVDKYQKWGVQIQVDGGSKFGGYYDTPESAAEAYDDLAKRHFGEFARTNKMMGLL